MERLADYTHQLTELIQHYVPAESVPPVLPSAVVLLFFGVGICVLGAKLARWFIAVTFAVSGLAIGLNVSTWVGFSPLLCALFGALAIGTVGYGLQRLWVGLFTGACLAVLATGSYSWVNVLPHWDGFTQTYQTVQAETFTVPSASPADSTNDGTAQGAAAADAPVDWDRLQDYMDRFDAYLKEKVPSFRRNGVLLAISGALAGFLMGVIFCRLTLILSTACVGTVLIATGLSMMGSFIGIDVDSMLRDRPEMTGLAVAAFFVASVLLQFLLTRSESSASKLPTKATK